MNVRLFKPSVGEAELEAVRGTFERSWLGLGPKVAEFEKAWSGYIGCKESVAVNSCTAALHLALSVFDFPKGSKVLVPAVTFVSTAAAVLYNGLEPVFVDVDPDTLSMDLSDALRKIDHGCVAVIPVHFGGHAVEMIRLNEIAREHGLAVIEDCAHCAGGSYRGRKLGTWGDIGCFSFEEKKGMTTGDGGMICTNKPIGERLRAPRWCGIDKDTWKREADSRDVIDARHWYYEVASLGWKYNMNDLAASIGLVQLGRLDEMNARRRQIVRHYCKGLRGLSTIRSALPYDPSKDYAYWGFMIRTSYRDKLIRWLKPRGVATGVHYMPLTMHPLFARYAGKTPGADKVWTELLTLPLHADLTDEEVDYVIDTTRRFETEP